MKAILLVAFVALAGCSAKVPQQNHSDREADESFARLNADLDKLKASTKHLEDGNDLMVEGVRILSDCQRVDAATWDANHCEVRRSHVLSKQRKYVGE